jgi:hypothetical protein
MYWYIIISSIEINLYIYTLLTYLHTPVNISKSVYNISNILNHKPEIPRYQRMLFALRKSPLRKRGSPEISSAQQECIQLEIPSPINKQNVLVFPKQKKKQKKAKLRILFD